MKRTRDYTTLMSATRWRKLRAKYLTAHPLCEECEARGLAVCAKEVHHITPIETGTDFHDMETLAYDYNNLQALCHACHVAKHIALHSKSKASNIQRQQQQIEAFKKKFL